MDEFQNKCVKENKIQAGKPNPQWQKDQWLSIWWKEMNRKKA